MYVWSFKIFTKLVPGIRYTILRDKCTLTKGGILSVKFVLNKKNYGCIQLQVQVQIINGS